MAAPQPTHDRRIRDARDRIIRVGLQRKKFHDLYHGLLTASWPRLIGLLVASYLTANALFAALYLLDPGGLENARPGSFLDHFFFSVQTMVTIGYGKMVPHSIYANVLVTVEAFVGMLAMAMATGLMFAKFSRPTARVLFSRHLLITPRDGVPSLVLRMANERANQIVEANLRLVLLRDEKTAEGEPVRRIVDLKLQRSSTAVFTLSWTAWHPITPDSPLYNETEESFRASKATVLASLVGIDETFNQTVHARHTYFADEVVWGGRFVDILSPRDDGRVELDYRRFHDVIPLEQKEKSDVKSG